MSLDLNEYFSLGLESTNNPIENAGMINVFRTPVDTSSTNLNRITFKFPKTGMLTADSMITLQPILSDSTKTQSFLTPNFINGMIGSIKRTRLLVDNKVLIDLERPALAENVKLYSRNTQVELAEKEYKLMGNQFRTKINTDGSEGFDINETRVFDNQNNTNRTISKNIILHESSSKVYGIPLRHLGCDFLEAAALPVFLLGHREMILELEFFADCREYVCNPEGASFNAGDVKINLANAELVSTHVMLPPEVEANEISNMARQPVSYPLLDKYVVKGVIDLSSTNIGQQKSETYRINFQNREVHNLMMCSVVNSPVTTLLCGNQKSIGMGDENLQLKINGLNLFDRPIDSQPLIYQLTTYSEDGRTLKVPLNAWNVTDLTLTATKQNADPLYLDYRGNFHYLKIDFSNGNQGVFGSGTVMKTAAEIDYKVTPITVSSPNQKSKNDMFFYVTISKLLSIGANQVNISY